MPTGAVRTSPTPVPGTVLYEAPKERQGIVPPPGPCTPSTRDVLRPRKLSLTYRRRASLSSPRLRTACRRKASGRAAFARATWRWRGTIGDMSIVAASGPVPHRRRCSAGGCTSPGPFLAPLGPGTNARQSGATVGARVRHVCGAARKCGRRGPRQVGRAPARRQIGGDLRAKSTPAKRLSGTTAPLEHPPWRDPGGGRRYGHLPVLMQGCVRELQPKWYSSPLSTKDGPACPRDGGARHAPPATSTVTRTAWTEPI